jgi:hypothetical protein
MVAVVRVVCVHSIVLPVRWGLNFCGLLLVLWEYCVENRVFGVLAQNYKLTNHKQLKPSAQTAQSVIHAPIIQQPLCNRTL